MKDQKKLEEPSWEQWVEHLTTLTQEEQLEELLKKTREYHDRLQELSGEKTKAEPEKKKIRKKKAENTKSGIKNVKIQIIKPILVIGIPVISYISCLLLGIDQSLTDYALKIISGMSDPIIRPCVFYGIRYGIYLTLGIILVKFT